MKHDAMISRIQREEAIQIRQANAAKVFQKKDCRKAEDTDA